MQSNNLFFHFFFALVLLLNGTQSLAGAPPSSLPLDVEVKGYTVPAGTLNGFQAETIALVLTLNMKRDWYTYTNSTGDLGKPTQLTGTTSDGTRLLSLYPSGTSKPNPLETDEMIQAYKSGSRLFALIPLEAVAPFPTDLKLDLLLCHPSKCVPARLNFSYTPPNTSTLPDASSQPWWDELKSLANTHLKKPTPTLQGKSSQSEQESLVDWQFQPSYLQPGLEVRSLFSALLMGLLAGLILNIMPCVLPVVSLKLTALLSAADGQAGGDRYRAFREHNIFFVLGVLSFFLLLAVVLGATGKAWGALFQYRWLVLALAGIMGALGASLFGLFHLPVIDLKFDTSHASPRRQAFFTGMLTTLLATPCSGPFLGGVLGWALIQGQLVIATVFISIGVGMAAPYLLLILNPRLARFLPKSGPWIEFVEKGIGFFLLGTAFYLVSIAYGVWTLRLLAPLWVVLAGGWLWRRIRDIGQPARWSTLLATLALLALTVIWTTPVPLETNPWEDFDPVSLNQSLGKEPLFLDFTADWCPTCKVLEATVMTDGNVARWKREHGIRFIKVDMTDPDPDAEALLQALGSRSIPTAAVFRRDAPQKPLVLRDLFTVKQVDNILDTP